jgi:hypothetical protein
LGAHAAEHQVREEAALLKQGAEKLLAMGWLASPYNFARARDGKRGFAGRDKWLRAESQC